MLIIVLSAIAFLVGVVIATLTGWTIPSGVFFLALVILWWRRGIGVLVFCLLFGFLRVEWFEQPVSPSFFGQHHMEGVLQEDWGQKNGTWSWILSTQQGFVLVQLSPYSEVIYGSRVRVEGQVESVETYAEGASYRHYLQRYRVVGVMEAPRLTVLAPPSISFLVLLHSLSTFLTEHLQHLLPESEASFAVGLLLGKRQTMDPDLQTAFRAVGLTHIVAISGSNIAMVVVCFFMFFAFLSFQKRLIASGVGVFCFVLLVGPSAAVVRAGLMGVLSLLGLYSGRRSMAFFGLLWSAVFMVLMNPFVLVYDVGFQLSFASTFGILTLVPMLERFFPKRLWMREALLLTLAAQIMTFPFIAFYFGQISWITPFVNVLVAPLIPLAMGSSAAALLFGVPAAASAWTFLWLIEKTALLCAAIPGVQVTIELSSWNFFVLLIFLFLWILSFYKSRLVRAFLRGSVAIPSMALDHESEMHERR